MGINNRMFDIILTTRHVPPTVQSSNLYEPGLYFKRKTAHHRGSACEYMLAYKKPVVILPAPFSQHTQDDAYYPNTHSTIVTFNGLFYHYMYMYTGIQPLSTNNVKLNETKIYKDTITIIVSKILMQQH